MPKRTFVIAREASQQATHAQNKIPHQEQSLIQRGHDGKILDRFALGGKEDIEMFDRFLSQHQPEAAYSIEKQTKEQKQAPLTATTIASNQLADTSTYSIHEKLRRARETKILRNWEWHNRQWEKFKKKMSVKLGKTQEELVMSRASEYREQMEEYDLIQKATPLHQKHGSEYWLMSLRGEGIRYVQVGNIFSGLFCPVIDERHQGGPQIRRPMSKKINKGLINDKQELHHKTWRTSTALVERKRQLRKNISKVRSHEIKEEDTAAFMVNSRDLFVWATESSRAYFDYIDLRAGVDDHFPTNIELRQDTEKRNSGEIATGPSLALFSLQGKKQSIINISTGCHRVVLHYCFQNDAPQSCSIIICNNGAVSLQYVWLKENMANTLEIPLLCDKSKFSVSKRYGTLQPGQEERVHFSFKSSCAGVFLERWKIETTPLIGTVSEAFVIEVHGIATATQNSVVRRKTEIKNCIRENILHNETPKFFGEENMNFQITERISSSELPADNLKQRIENLEYIYGKAKEIITESGSETKSDDQAETASDLSMAMLVETVNKAINILDEQDIRRPVRETKDEEGEEESDEDSLEELSIEEQEIRLKRAETEAKIRSVTDLTSLKNQFRKTVVDSLMEEYQSDAVMATLATQLSTLCEEIPIISAIFRDQCEVSQLEIIKLCNEEEHQSKLRSAILHDPVCSYLREMHMCISSLLGDAIENAVACTHSKELDRYLLRRKKNGMMVSDKLTIDSEFESLSNKNVFIHVDFDRINGESETEYALESVIHVLKYKPKTIFLLGHLSVSEQTEEKSLEVFVRPIQKATGTNTFFCPCSSDFCRFLEEKTEGVCQIFLLEHIAKINDSFITNEHVNEEEQKVAQTTWEYLRPFCDVLIVDDIDSIYCNDIITVLAEKKPCIAGDILYRSLLPYSLLEKANSYYKLAIVGGSGLHNKIAQLDSLLNVVDEIFLGGVVALTFQQYLSAHSVGSSMVDYKSFGAVGSLLRKASRKGVKLHLPLDYVAGDVLIDPETESVLSSDSIDEDSIDEDAVISQISNDQATAEISSKKYKGTVKTIEIKEAIPYGWIAYDIGPKSVENLGTIIERSQLVVWSGLLGAVEYDKFHAGSSQTLQHISRNQNAQFLYASKRTSSWLNLKLGKPDEKGEWRSAVIEGNAAQSSIHLLW